MREFWIYPWRIVPLVFRIVMRSFEEILIAKQFLGLFLVLLWLIVFWHVYAPIHELMHVFGCWITGGEVTELALKPQYGGTILKNIFPFIVADSDYAGQLTGFTTPNDFAYFIVDIFPYLLSVPGLALFFIAAKKKSPMLFSLATILGLTPLFVITGDFYEMVSLGISRLGPLFDSQLGWRSLVSDDVFRLIGELNEAGQLGFVPLALIGLGLLAAIYSCLLCWVGQLHVACLWQGEAIVLGEKSSLDKAGDPGQIMTTQLES